MKFTPRVVIAGIAVIGGVIALLASSDTRLTNRPVASRTVDEAPVAVFPFSVRSSQPPLIDLRDALQDLLAARLMGADGSSQVIDPLTVLSSVRHARSARDDDLMAVAAGLGAGRLVRGQVSGSPDDLSIDATVVEVPGGSVRAHASVRGSADSLPYLADRLAVRLLATQTARDSAELAGLSATSLPALRAYLAGRHAYRRGMLGANSEAANHFERAVFLDSTFALAGLRVAEIAVRFGMAERDERWKLDAIWHQRERLGPNDRALLEAYLGPHYPRPATLAELIAAAEKATIVAPHRAEAWHIAGVGYFRFGPRVGYPDWERRAGEAFRRALALDSTEVFPLQYLLLLAAVAGDRDAVRRYSAVHRSHGPMGGQQTEFIEWVGAVVSGDTVRLAGLRNRIPDMTLVSLQSIVEWSENLSVGLEDAERAGRALEQRARSAAQRRTVTMRLVPFMLNRGRPGEASRLLAGADRGFGQAVDVGVLEFRIYAARYWDGDSSEAAAAARSLEEYLDGTPVRFGQVKDRQSATCALAHWRLGSGDLAGAEAAMERIHPLAASSDSEPTGSTTLCAAAAEAHLAAARHRGDAAAALDRLDALLAAGSDVQYMFPTVATVIAARLYEARGDLPRALALTRRRTFWWNWLLSTPLREEGRLAARVGNTSAAIRAYRHYLALRSDPEPSVMAEVERVRAELERLESR